MKKKLAMILFFCAFFAGCDDNAQEEDISIGEITIYNIPENIPVFENDTVTVPAFKIYLNASNSQSEKDPPAAKGVAKVSEGKLENGKYTVTIQLKKPNPQDELNPNFDTDPWFGTASYFSVVISPQDVAIHGVNAIWAKAGTTLNKGKKSCDWNNLMNFRELIKRDPEDKMEFAKKTKALFTEIVCKDPDINKP